jgi:hypothetical protein
MKTSMDLLCCKTFLCGPKEFVECCWCAKKVHVLEAALMNRAGSQCLICSAVRCTDCVTAVQTASVESFSPCRFCETIPNDDAGRARFDREYAANREALSNKASKVRHAAAGLCHDLATIQLNAPLRHQKGSAAEGAAAMCSEFECTSSSDDDAAFDAEVEHRMAMQQSAIVKFASEAGVSIDELQAALSGIR